MRYLITGASGFVGKHLKSFLKENVPQSTVLGIGRDNLSDEQVDLHDRKSLTKTLKAFNPHFIIHLASDSSVSYSWKQPIESFSNNVNIFLNLIESVRKLSLESRILSVGSSEQFGIVRTADLPLSENSPQNPISPYAVARTSQEMLSKVYADGYGLDIVMTRSFNHFGPGQDERFVISSFAKQLIQKMHDKNDSPLLTGDLSIIRDFIDVRDVVRIYNELLHKGEKGEIYNVCSGKGFSLKEILEHLIKLSGSSVEIKTDPALVRPMDNPHIIGDNTKLKGMGIEPCTFDLETSIQDVLNFWKQYFNEDSI